MEQLEHECGNTDAADAWLDANPLMRFDLEGVSFDNRRVFRQVEKRVEYSVNQTVAACRKRLIGILRARGVYPRQFKGVDYATAERLRACDTLINEFLSLLQNPIQADWATCNYWVALAAGEITTKDGKKGDFMTALKGLRAVATALHEVEGSPDPWVELKVPTETMSASLGPPQEWTVDGMDAEMDLGVEPLPAPRYNIKTFTVNLEGEVDDSPEPPFARQECIYDCQPDDDWFGKLPFPVQDLCLSIRKANLNRLNDFYKILKSRELKRPGKERNIKLYGLVLAALWDIWKARKFYLNYHSVRSYVRRELWIEPPGSTAVKLINRISTLTMEDIEKFEDDSPGEILWRWYKKITPLPKGCYLNDKDWRHIWDAYDLRKGQIYGKPKEWITKHLLRLKARRIELMLQKEFRDGA
jgi:hypothetical protein